MSQDISQEILKYKWEPWLRRNFYAFILSIIACSTSKKAFKKIGLSDWELKALVFTNNSFYWSNEVFDAAIPKLRKWMKENNVSVISNRLDYFYKKNRVKVINLCADDQLSLKSKLLSLNDIFHQVGSFIWSAHMLEHVLWQELKDKTKQYIKTDLDQYIGDASFPEKKNTLALMEEEMRQGVNLEEIRKKYSWMRARDGFARPYSFKELADYRSKLKKYKPHIYPIIPKQLAGIYREARELVYLRTKRTDVFYELIFLSRPILKMVAKKYNINFQDLKYYDFATLISGRPKKYSKNVSCLEYEGKSIFSNDKFFSNKMLIIRLWK